MNIFSILLIAYLGHSLIISQPESVRESYHIEFEKIDNRAEVYIGDSLIYNSGIVRRNPKLAIWVDIDDSLLDYSNELTIKLINGMEGTKDGDDIHWEIKFSVFKDEEVIYWEWVDSDDAKAGVVFEDTYILE